MGNPSILVLTPDFPPERGGIQVLLHRVVSSWRQLDPCVVAFASEGAAAFDAEQPFAVERVGAARATHRMRLGALNVRALQLGLRRRPSCILSGHIVTSPAAWILSRTLRVPFVQYLYGRELVVRPRLTSFAARRAARTIVISRFTRDLALSCGAKADKLRLIHPGVDLAPACDENRLTRRDIVVVGRLDERYKGHDVLLRALPLVRANVPDARLVVVGDGILRETYASLAASLGVADAVVFAGSVDDAGRDRALTEASVFAMPSRKLTGGAAEGFGIVFLEAGARSLPVVAGAVGGTLDAVIDGETGLLVDPADHIAVADAVTRLLEEPELAQRLGGNGARRAQGFAWPRIGEAVEDVVLELLEAR
jgi:phosphatidylinositol alpha-1,6-mannosyltransferase